MRPFRFLVRCGAGRRTLTIGALTFGLLVTPQLAFADTELGHDGTVGAHALTDTATNPGATCNYEFKSLHNDGKLIEIVVRPPRMRAVAGQSDQTVGWKFVVQRRVQGIGSASDWVKRYASPEMTAVTDDDSNASFSPASVPVRPGGPTAGGIYQYRVLVVMLWHRDDGSVQGKARHRVDHYNSVLDSGGSEVVAKRCNAWSMPGA